MGLNVDMPEPEFDLRWGLNSKSPKLIASYVLLFEVFLCTENVSEVALSRMM